jgi:hypothetical protein
MEIIVSVAKKLFAEWQTLAYVGAIMVSTVITLIGILKPIIFDRIRCKLLRKMLLATSNIVFSFLATAVYFLVDGRNWEWYVCASWVTAITCVLTYFVYENYGLRDGIHKVGTLAINKFGKILYLIWRRESPTKIDAEIEKAHNELKATVRTEIKPTKKSNKKDKELENL